MKPLHDGNPGSSSFERSLERIQKYLDSSEFDRKYRTKRDAVRACKQILSSIPMIRKDMQAGYDNALGENLDRSQVEALAEWLLQDIEEIYHDHSTVQSAVNAAKFQMRNKYQRVYMAPTRYNLVDSRNHWLKENQDKNSADYAEYKNGLVGNSDNAVDARPYEGIAETDGFTYSVLNNMGQTGILEMLHDVFPTKPKYIDALAVTFGLYEGDEWLADATDQQRCDYLNAGFDGDPWKSNTLTQTRKRALKALPTSMAKNLNEEDQQAFIDAFEVAWQRDSMQLSAEQARAVLYKGSFDDEGDDDSECPLNTEIDNIVSYYHDPEYGTSTDWRADYE